MAFICLYNWALSSLPVFEFFTFSQFEQVPVA